MATCPANKVCSSLFQMACEPASHLLVPDTQLEQLLELLRAEQPAAVTLSQQLLQHSLSHAASYRPDSTQQASSQRGSLRRTAWLLCCQSSGLSPQIHCLTQQGSVSSLRQAAAALCCSSRCSCCQPICQLLKAQQHALPPLWSCAAALGLLQHHSCSMAQLQQGLSWDMGSRQAPLHVRWVLAPSGLQHLKLQQSLLCSSADLHEVCLRPVTHQPLLALQQQHSSHMLGAGSRIPACSATLLSANQAGEEGRGRRPSLGAGGICQRSQGRLPLLTRLLGPCPCPTVSLDTCPEELAAVRFCGSAAIPVSLQQVPSLNWTP